MTMLGVRVTLLLGPTVAVPVPPPVIQALRAVEVTHKDEGHSGFSITFNVGRSGPADLLDYALVANPLLKPFNRVIVIVTFNVTPHVLMDGIIARQELSQGQQPGSATLTIKGLDVSVMMDREVRSAEHPAQDETIIANKLIASYAKYGLIPMVIPPLAIDPPIPIERTPVQQVTDLEFLRQMAARHGYVFYVAPGPAPFTNTAYFGPKVPPGLPQRAITLNMGPETNATLDEARDDALGATRVEGKVQDRLTNQTMPVRSTVPLRAPLATQPGWLVNMPNARVEQQRASGLSAMQAMGRAQGAMEASIDTVKLEGELDAGSYGGVLSARRLVGVCGAGYRYDGFFYVKKVTHKIELGKYRQRFLLTREGTGSTTPAVIP
jgi:hypothetical protein